MRAFFLAPNHTQPAIALFLNSEAVAGFSLESICIEYLAFGVFLTLPGLRKQHHPVCARFMF